jgi:hypothetical protein
LTRAGDGEGVEEGGLFALAECEGEGAAAVEHAVAADFERANEGQATGHGARVAADIGAGVGLVAVEMAGGELGGTEGALFEIDGFVGDAVPLEGGEEGLLPFGVFVEDADFVRQGA